MSVPEEAIAAAAEAIDREYYESTGRHIEWWARDIAIIALEAAWPHMPAPVPEPPPVPRLPRLRPLPYTDDEEAT